MSKNNPFLRVSAIKIRDFARIETCDVTLDAENHIIPVRGKNGHGKSFLLKALSAATGGGRLLPKDPIRHGAEDGEIEIELAAIGDGDDIEIRRRFLGSGTSSLKVTAGGMLGNQGTLDGLVGPLRDPLAFLQMPEKKQVEMIFGMVDLGEFDIDRNKGQLALAIEERRDIGRDVKRLQGAVDSLTSTLGGFDPETAIDSADLMAELSAAQAFEDAAKDAERIAADRDRITFNAADKCEELRNEIERLQNALNEAVKDEAKCEKLHETAKGIAEAARAAVPDLEAIKAKADEASANDEKRGQWNELQSRKSELAEEEKKHSGKDGKVERLRFEREQALGSAKWPAEGMGYDPENGTLVLHGSRWDQASDGQLFTAAVEIAVAQDSRLRVLWIRNGSLMDSERWEKLEALMKKHDYYAFVEEVALESSGDGLFCDDGKVSQDEKAKENAPG